jgi:hypothetical protein
MPPRAIGHVSPTLPDLSLLLPLLEEVIAILKRSTGSSGRHATIRVGGGWHMTVLEVVMGSMVPFTGGGGWDRHKKDYEEREREREREREKVTKWWWIQAPIRQRR